MPRTAAAFELRVENSSVDCCCELCSLLSACMALLSSSEVLCGATRLRWGSRVVRARRMGTDSKSRSFFDLKNWWRV